MKGNLGENLAKDSTRTLEMSPLNISLLLLYPLSLLGKEMRGHSGFLKTSVEFHMSKFVKSRIGRDRQEICSRCGNYHKRALRGAHRDNLWQGQRRLRYEH